MEFVYAAAVIAVLILITVVPVMMAAKWARARRSSFPVSLAAVVVATVTAQLALHGIGEPLLALIAAVVVACVSYALVLGTSFVGAVGIAVVALVLQTLIVIGLIGLGMQIPISVPLGPSI